MIASSLLSDYLKQPKCSIEKLILSNTDIDDNECCRFILSLQSDNCLNEIDMSQNKIGISENLNSINPNKTTGAEALANFLRKDYCKLTSISLGWNLIRLDSASDLCSSIGFNPNITYLDLSFNTIGKDGGIALGNSLLDNRALTTLIISNCGIDALACICICAGLLENINMKKLIIDGNPIGEEGARTVMLLPAIIGEKIEMSVRNCKLTGKDPKCWFNGSLLLGNCELCLSNTFDRAVAFIIMQLIVFCQSYYIVESEWKDETGVNVNLELFEKEVISYDNERHDENQKYKIAFLQEFIKSTSDEEKAKNIFNELDIDESGRLDKKEFRILARMIGNSNNYYTFTTNSNNFRRRYY